MTATSRRRAAPVVWAVAVGLAGLGLVATVGRGHAPLPGTRDVPQARFGPDELAAVAAWQQPLRATVVALLVVELAVPLALVATSRGRRLLARLGGERVPTLRGAVVAAVAVALATAPLRWWLGFVVARRVGLRRGGAGLWAADWALATTLRVAGLATVVAGVLWLVRRHPRGWPALLTVVATVTTVVLLLLEPVVTTRLQLRPTPLEEGPVAQAVTGLLDRSELDDARVVVGAAARRSSALNAYVTGVGPTRTVVLLDTLLERPLPEVRAVVAHELAHAELDDPLRGVLAVATLVLPAALLGRALRRRAPGVPLAGAQVGAAGVAVVLALELLGAPAVTWHSRRVEASADARALELTQDPAAAVAVTRQFVLTSLSDPRPPGWWVALRGTHPTPTQRITRAVEVGEQLGAPVPLPAPAPTGTGATP